MPVTNVLKEGSPLGKFEKILIGMRLLSPSFILVTHIGMFISSITSLGTPEQQAEWLEKAETCRTLGTYVQTELGHGTFVRGLETTATYDPTSREFVINTPSITAYKVKIRVHEYNFTTKTFSSGGPEGSVTPSTTLWSLHNSTPKESITDFNHSSCSCVIWTRTSR